MLCSSLIQKSLTNAVVITEPGFEQFIVIRIMGMGIKNSNTSSHSKFLVDTVLYLIFHPKIFLNKIKWNLSKFIISDYLLVYMRLLKDFLIQLLYKHHIDIKP